MRILTEEHKRKISESQKGVKSIHWGKTTTDKQKRAVSIFTKNRWESMDPVKKKEFFNKLSSEKIGKPRSLETRQKISMSLTKTNSFTEFRSSFRKRLKDTIEYVCWRKTILERDKYSCQDCGVIGKNFEIHHIIPLSTIIRNYSITTLEEARSCDLLWDIKNGITYCKECHIKNDEIRGKKYRGKT